MGRGVEGIRMYETSVLTGCRVDRVKGWVDVGELRFGGVVVVVFMVWWCGNMVIRRSECGVVKLVAGIQRRCGCGCSRREFEG